MCCRCHRMSVALSTGEEALQTWFSGFPFLHTVCTMWIQKKRWKQSTGDMTKTRMRGLKRRHQKDVAYSLDSQLSSRLLQVSYTFFYLIHTALYAPFLFTVSINVFLPSWSVRTLGMAAFGNHMANPAMITHRMATSSSSWPSRDRVAWK